MDINLDSEYGIPFSSICRTCLQLKSDMRSVRESAVVEMLSHCSSIQILNGDGLPDLICSPCLRQVNKSFHFKKLCEKSDTILKQHIVSALLPSEFQNNCFKNVKKTNITKAETDEKIDNQEAIISTFTDDDIAKSTINKISRLSEDEDTAGFIDCPELDLEPECNLVESALAALQEDLERRNVTDNGKHIEWSKEELLSSKTIKLEDETEKNICNIEEIISCSQCTENFTSTSDLSAHMSIHSSDDIQCNICNKKFVRMRMLKRHLKIHMSWKAFRCQICTKEFTESGALNRHIKSHSGLIKEKKHFCLTCGKGYQDQTYLAIHMRKHTGERPFSCDQCPKTFTDQRLLASHIKTHTQDKMYQCVVCAKRFTHSSSLTTHLRTHTGEKPYTCKICNKKFNQSSNLSLHMRTHTGIKPYICGICNKSFASSSTLTYHSRTHTGEKPYLCSACGKSFARSEDVTLHMRTHTGERPYECSTCKKKFTTSSHRNQHMLVHTGEKPYMCRVCDKGCISLTQMRQHVLKVHGGACDDFCDASDSQDKNSSESIEKDYLEDEKS